MGAFVSTLPNTDFGKDSADLPNGCRVLSGDDVQVFSTEHEEVTTFDTKELPPSQTVLGQHSLQSRENLVTPDIVCSLHESNPCFSHLKEIDNRLQVGDCAALGHRVCQRQHKKSLLERIKSNFPAVGEVIESFEWIQKVAHISFPPRLSSVIEKAAFHPPEKGKYYFLYTCENGNSEQYLDADDALGKPNLKFCVRPYLYRGFLEGPIAAGFLRIKVHIIKTPMKDCLVAIHVTCNASKVSGYKSPKIMIFAQPNSSDIGACMMSDPTLVEIADSLCCDLVAFDYSGYGCSTGIPSEEAVYDNIEAIYEFVKTELGYEDKDIVLFGFSMGTAVSIYLASLHPTLCGLILVAPFTSLLRILGKTDNPETSRWDRFSSFDKAPNIESRTLICHGMEDTMIGTEHSDVLQTRLQNVAEPFYIPDATHRGIYGEHAMWKRIKGFVEEDLGFRRDWEGIVTFSSHSSNETKF